MVLILSKMNAAKTKMCFYIIIKNVLQYNLFIHKSLYYLHDKKTKSSLYKGYIQKYKVML